ncbi:hypothetical protein DITRI_Ditri06bG0090500 [Diplodiscus trichospermus]
MEDVLPKAESLLHPTNLSGDKAIKEVQGEEDRARGFINHLISNLVTGGDADEDKQTGNKTPPKGGKK